MKFKIKASSFMSGKESPLGSIEDRLIRIPSDIRHKFGMNTGLFLSLNGVDGEVMLQAAKAYSTDAQKDNSCVYVSQSTYGILDLKQKLIINPADDILIGCDPEFFLVNKSTGFNISASHFFPHYGEVGSDCGLAELRPRPNHHEIGLVTEIYSLLKKAYSHINSRTLFRKQDIHMVSTSHREGQAAGFHIHFGLPYTLLEAGRYINGVNPLLAYIVHILDYYIGIPAILPEGSADSTRRSIRFSSYGKPGDHRVDQLTLEYRVPGGHLLRHPILTAGILAISIVVMKDVLSRLQIYSNGFQDKAAFQDYKELRNLYPNLPDKEMVNNCIVSEDTGPAINQLDTILRDIQRMIGYKQNDKTIVNYFDYITSYITEAKGFSDNIEINWRLIENAEQPREMAVL